MHTYLSTRLAQLLQARDKWQTIQRSLADQKREAEDLLQRLDGAINEVQTALTQPEETAPDADRVLH
jgi:hypothetical protein